MADSRSLTFGMKFGLSEAIGQIGRVTDSLDEIKQGMIWAEQESDEMGSRISKGAHEAESGLKDVEAQMQKAGNKIADGSKDAENDFRKIGNSAQTMGQAWEERSGLSRKGLKFSARIWIPV